MKELGRTEVEMTCCCCSKPKTKLPAASGQPQRSQRSPPKVAPQRRCRRCSDGCEDALEDEQLLPAALQDGCVRHAGGVDLHEDRGGPRHQSVAGGRSNEASGPV